MCTLDHKKRCYICPKCGAEQPMTEAIKIERESKG